MTEIHGSCDEQFAPVRDAFAATSRLGLDVGASVAVTVDGEFVVDLWAGHTDEERTQPWERDTIINVWSTTKTMTALCALVLADRGELDFDSPVSRYWPEFAAGGKAGIEVRHLMGHTAGLPAWNPPVTEADLYDWEKSTSMLAAQEPWWEPGTMSGYHAISQGHWSAKWCAGSPPDTRPVLRRRDRRTAGRRLPHRPAGGARSPHGAGDPAAAAADRAAAARTPIAYSRRSPVRGCRQRASWEDAWRRAEIPAAERPRQRQIGRGRAVARRLRWLARRRDVALPEGCDRIFDVQAVGTDLVLGVPLRLGMGYGIVGEETPLGPSTRRASGAAGAVRSSSSISTAACASRM